MSIGKYLRLDKPEYFKDPAFINWINTSTPTVASWHDRTKTEATDFSDTFIYYEEFCDSLDELPTWIREDIQREIEKEDGCFVFGLIWVSPVG